MGFEVGIVEIGKIGDLQLPENSVDAEQLVATLDDSVSVDQRLREGVGDFDLLAVYAEDEMAEHVDEQALVVAGKGAVARVLDTVRRLNCEEPLTGDGHVKHAARAPQRPLLEVGPDALEAIDAPVRVIAGETLLRLAYLTQEQGIALEARHFDVGQVVGDRFVTGGLGQHARCRNEDAFDHTRSRSHGVDCESIPIPVLV